MSNHGFAAGRSRERLVPDFPARPVLPLTAPCSGLILIDRDGGALQSARQLRDDIGAMWRGVLPDKRANAQANDPYLMLLFERPIDLAPGAWASALPFVLARGGALKSFGDVIDVPPPEGGGEAHYILLWWAGKSHRIVLDSLESVPLSELWDLPEAIVHPSLVPSRPAVAPVGVQPYAQATIPLVRDGEGVFDEAERGLAALDERTTLRSIGRQLWANLFRRRQAPSNEDGGGQGRAAQREPGLLANMTGWLLWHTPLGVPLARQFAERTKLVERLMAAGDVDSALRLALKLANKDSEKSKRSAYPTRLPGMRARLDFDFGLSGVTLPIFDAGSFHSLQMRYAALAEKLERDGDFRRAAYVRSQLQGEHLHAVQTLARGELFREAAKLALDAGLEPVVAITMFFKADELDVALALAKRADCFDRLAEDSRLADPEFHAFVIRAWTDRLVATSQMLHALQITDRLASGETPDPGLLELRSQWVDLAFRAVAGDEASPELVGRGLLIADWGTAKREQGGFFPLGFGAANPATVAMQTLAGWISQDRFASAERLYDFSLILLRLAEPQGTEQRSFWKIAAAGIVEICGRALISSSAGSLSHREMQELQSLLRKAELHVFALDVAKLRLIPPKKPGSGLIWTLPAPTVRQAPVQLACLMHNGTMILWRGNDRLQLLDSVGRSLWQGSVSNLVGLVPVGGSSDAILVQRDVNGGICLTRFASRARAFHPIGKLDLAAWHDLTSDGQWMVQVGGQIGALDLVKLCAPTPEIEFLWSCSLTANLEVSAFYRHAQSPAWITRDVTDERRDLMELWTLHHGRTLKTKICDQGPVDRGTADAGFSSWFWTNEGAPDIRSAAEKGRHLSTVDWSDAEERRACAAIAARMRDGTHAAIHIVCCDGQRAKVELRGQSEAESVAGSRQVRLSNLADNRPVNLSIIHDESATLTCLARGERITSKAYGAAISDQSHLVLCADNYGRLITVDLRAQRVTLS